MTIRQLTAIIDQGLALKLISQAYTEIASAKLKKIRTAVEKDRYFLEDLAKVYQVVKQLAAQRQMLPAKNSRAISIVITSNYHFYGNVNSNLIKFFIEHMQQQPAVEQIVIGKTALEHLSGIKYALKYEPVVLKSDYPTLAELNQLVNRVKNYSRILIYYSKLKTVMVQNPFISDITQTSYLKDTPPNPTQKEQLFIFEPELKKILDFFDSQVTNLLLQQTFLESELSRTASRLISMDSAQSNADKYITEQKRLLATVKRSIANSRILETYTALSSLRRDIYE